MQAAILGGNPINSPFVAFFRKTKIYLTITFWAVFFSGFVQQAFLTPGLAIYW